MVATNESAIAAKLLACAVDLFAHKGYQATSTREIVEAAGVTKPMLYYYFENKEGLLAAAMSHFVDPFHERLRRVFAETTDPRERLTELVWVHLDFCQSHKSLARLFYALSFGPDDQAGQVDLSRYIDEGNALLAQAVEDVRAAGLIRAGSEESFLIAVHGTINILVMASLKESHPLTDELARRIIDDLWQGYQNR